MNEGQPTAIKVASIKSIPAPPGMPPWELLANLSSRHKLAFMYKLESCNGHPEDEYYRRLLPNSSVVENFDFEKMAPTNGSRVAAYSQFLQLGRNAKNMRKYLSGADVVNRIGFAQSAEAVCRHMNQIRDELLMASRLQQYTVKSYNPGANEVDEIYLMPLSQYDETNFERLC